MLVLRNPANGELVCVRKFQVFIDAATGGKADPPLDPHKGWDIVEDREGPPPENATWVEGQGFVVDQEKAAAVKESARLNSLSREQFMTEVAARVAKGPPIA